MRSLTSEQGGCTRMRSFIRDEGGRARVRSAALVASLAGGVIDRVALPAGSQMQRRAAFVAKLRTLRVVVRAEQALRNEHGPCRAPHRRNGVRAYSASNSELETSGSRPRKSYDSAYNETCKLQPRSEDDQERRQRVDHKCFARRGGRGRDPRGDMRAAHRWRPPD